MRSLCTEFITISVEKNTYALHVTTGARVLANCNIWQRKGLWIAVSLQSSFKIKNPYL